MLKDFPAASPHGEIVEVFENIFFVTGSVEMMSRFQLSRNMIIVREGTELTLISSVRLDNDGLQALDALGEVKHVLKLGAYHLGVNNGIDDPFYVDRYQAKLWAMPEMKHAEGLETTNTLKPDGVLPFEDVSFFSYVTSKKPEGLILINRENGILVSADSLQNWAEPDRFFSDLAATQMQDMGFIKPANVGPEWLQACEPQVSDFERVAALDFRHLLPSHGSPIINNAKATFAVTFKKMFDI